MVTPVTDNDRIFMRLICELSFAETWGRAQGFMPELERRLGDINTALDVPITININGCPNSCANSSRRHRVQGTEVDGGHGGSVEGL